MIEMPEGTCSQGGTIYIRKDLVEAELKACDQELKRMGRLLEFAEEDVMRYRKILFALFLAALVVGVWQVMDSIRVKAEGKQNVGMCSTFMLERNTS